MNTYAADGTMKCENDKKKKCLDSKTQISTTCRDKSLQKLCTSKASLFFFLETERKSFFLCRERKNKYCGGKKKQARAMKQGRCSHLSWSHRNPPPKNYVWHRIFNNSLLQSVTIFSKVRYLGTYIDSIQPIWMTFYGVPVLWSTGTDSVGASGLEHPRRIPASVVSTISIFYRSR